MLVGVTDSNPVSPADVIDRDYAYCGIIQEVRAGQTYTVQCRKSQARYVIVQYKTKTSLSLAEVKVTGGKKYRSQGH